MNLSREHCMALAAVERVGHLATASATGQPHLVPITFALVDEGAVIGVDEKPKSSTDLKRIRNIYENPRTSLLWDRYDEDWSRLWWVRADGGAEILEAGGTWAAAWAALNNKYPQYEGQTHEGPVISVMIDRWNGWSYSDGGPAGTHA